MGSKLKEPCRFPHRRAKLKLCFALLFNTLRLFKPRLQSSGFNCKQSRVDLTITNSIYSKEGLKIRIVFFRLWRDWQLWSATIESAFRRRLIRIVLTLFGCRCRNWIGEKKRLKSAAVQELVPVSDGTVLESLPMSNLAMANRLPYTVR